VPTKTNWRSKRFVALMLIGAIALGTLTLCAGCGEGHTPTGKRVIVLGLDGLDYNLTKSLIDQGRLPNFARLAREGFFQPLGTSVPPQSPVAWSNFITGMDAGGHGIFDFIHRDPKTLLPYASTSRTEGATKSIKLGKWQIPLSGGKIELLRHGKPFWQVLEENGVETTIIRMPANFPPSGTATRELSGMGTPDLTGSPGTFSYYTTNTLPFADEHVTGGVVYPVSVIDNVVEGQLVGPDNPFLVEPEKVKASFNVYLDPVDPVTKLVVGNEERILKVGEWTDWMRIEFRFIDTPLLRDIMPGAKVTGIARFYLKSAAPEFELYVTPINIDPFGPAMPVSTPNSYATDLANATGGFYTQGFPEDTKALSHHVFTTSEFITQSSLAGEENIEQYKYVLDQFDDGLLFYYFGNVDQTAHMMWRRMDPEHPAYDPELDAPFDDVIRGLYVRMDDVLGYTLEHLDPNSMLIVMSDHGFGSWRRAFHLNTWLKENGYLTLRDPDLKDDPGWLSNVDWRNTRAYGIGLNGLYINLRGRERFGSVHPSDRKALMDEIAWKLLQMIDPETDKPAVTKVYKREEVYEDRGYLQLGPDILVGYDKETRCSFESASGEIPSEIFGDNDEEWSGDHCVDDESVPGILLATRVLKTPVTSLKNLSAAILAEFDVSDDSAQQ